MWRTGVAIACGLALGTAAAPDAVAGQDFDVVIRNGRIVDGTGNPWFRGDVGIVGRRIAAVGDLADASAARVVDADDRIVAPGFWDMSGGSAITLLVDQRAASKVTQGITTILAGEGYTVAPAEPREEPNRLGVVQDWSTLGEYFRRLEAARPAVNFGTNVGSLAVRRMVMDFDDRRPTAAEMDRMKRLVAQAMEDGALGLSSLLQDPPDRFNTTGDLVELAKVAASYGGTYFTHQRSEGDAIEASLREVFRIAEEADLPAHVFHLKVVYVHNWGMADQVVEMIEDAREEGLEITTDVYPYTRAGGRFFLLLPPWVSEGGIERRNERLRDPSVRERIKREMESPSTEWENEYHGAGGAEGFIITAVPDDAWSGWVGRTLADVAEEQGRDPRELVFDIILAGDASFTSGLASEEDVRTILPLPWSAFQTDAGIAATDGPLAGFAGHPRAYGTFPKVLGHYVRELGLLRLEDAVRKATSLPAQIAGVTDRGLVREGMYADLVIFDETEIRDLATYQDPNRYSAGIETVFVNGEIVYSQGAFTDARPGMVIRGPGYRR